MPLCEQILKYVTYEGEVVLDSFAGSSVIVEAALNKKRGGNYMINGDINEFIDILWSGEEHHSTLSKTICC